MNAKEREAYHVGLYNLPGNYDGRLWPTSGEYLWWQRGRRERAERLNRQTEAPQASYKWPSFSVFMEQLAAGLGAVGGMVGFVIGFGLKGTLILNVALATITGIAAGAAGPLILRFVILRIGRLFNRNRWYQPPPELDPPPPDPHDKMHKREM